MITEYLEAVREQIRWKRAQPMVLEEINNHINDQKNALIEEGLDEATATYKAITEMGDPVVVGGQLDHVHRPKPDWMLLALIGGMLLLGFAIQFFMDSAFDRGWVLQQQVVWAGIAVIVMLASYFADFTIIGKNPKTIFRARRDNRSLLFLYRGSKWRERICNLSAAAVSDRLRWFDLQHEK